MALSGSAHACAGTTRFPSRAPSSERLSLDDSSGLRLSLAGRATRGSGAPRRRACPGIGRSRCRGARTAWPPGRRSSRPPAPLRWGRRGRRRRSIARRTRRSRSACGTGPSRCAARRRRRKLCSPKPLMPAVAAHSISEGERHGAPRGRLDGRRRVGRRDPRCRGQRRRRERRGRARRFPVASVRSPMSRILRVTLSRSAQAPCHDVVPDTPVEDAGRRSAVAGRQAG